MSPVVKDNFYQSPKREYICYTDLDEELTGDSEVAIMLHLVSMFLLTLSA